MFNDKLYSDPPFAGGFARGLVLPAVPGIEAFAADGGREKMACTVGVPGSWIRDAEKHGIIGSRLASSGEIQIFANA